jgi:hypothetical protein
MSQLVDPPHKVFETKCVKCTNRDTEVFTSVKHLQQAKISVGLIGLFLFWQGAFPTPGTHI